MIRTGEEYRESICDGGEVYINEKVVQKAGANVTGDGEFLGTTAAAINNKST
jgi:aromatic ring hydroxylase